MAMSFKIGIGLFTGQVPQGSGRTFQREYRDCLELARLTEELGLDSVWVSEHHFAEDGYLPSLLPALAAVAAVTEKIELGTGVVLAPFHAPIRLAEDFAVVDQLSGGRTICGLGLGWRDEEFRAFHIPIETRARRLVEITEILRRAWTEERFTYRGRYYSHEQVAVTPKPARVPPILIGGFVDGAIRRAGRIADGYLSSRGSVARARQAFQMAAEERTNAAKEGPPIVGVLQNAFVTDDPERDWPAVRDGVAHQLGVYAGWSTGSDVPGRPLEVSPPDEDTIRSITPFGAPDEVASHLEGVTDVLAAYPESHLVLRVHYPGMDLDPAAKALDLVAQGVAPRLRARADRR